jgi:hypothetical protein
MDIYLSLKLKPPIHNQAVDPAGTSHAQTTPSLNIVRIGTTRQTVENWVLRYADARYVYVGG